MSYANIDFDRAIRRWGKQGQDLIENSSLVIVGLDRLGTEIAKSASILGVKNLFLIDNQEQMYDKFLDIKSGKKPQVKELSDIIPQYLNSECSPIGYGGQVSSAILSEIMDKKGIDGIIDASNDPNSQYKCLEFCYQNRIPLFVGAAGYSQGAVSYYSALDSYDSSNFRVCLPQFEGSLQGTIISNLLAGLIAEEYRKNLFIINRSKFRNVKYCNRSGNERSFYKDVEGYVSLLGDFEYSINDPRRINENGISLIDKVDNRKEEGLERKSLLLLGCGAIGNYAADMLARHKVKRLDVVDFDKFESTNLNRQPLAYSSVGEIKCQVVSKRINNISGKRISRPIIGFVGENYDKAKLAESRINRRDVTLLSKEWFRKNRYDAIIGCFDNIEVRVNMNEYATELGLNYFDGGTSPEGGKATSYSPGETNCIFCNPTSGTIRDIVEVMKRTNQNNDLKRKKLLEKNPDKFNDYFNFNSNSCHQEWIEPSINMPNQIVAALLVSEVRRLFNPEYGKLADKIIYESNSRNKIVVEHNKLRCNCGRK